MNTDERIAWTRLVLEANRIGRSGRRVIAVDVIQPTTAAGGYSHVLVTDNGPSTATENW